jgi:hypothetical protein
MVKNKVANYSAYIGQGKKRALLIGINYTGTQNELSGIVYFC